MHNSFLLNSSIPFKLLSLFIKHIVQRFIFAFHWTIFSWSFCSRRTRRHLATQMLCFEQGNGGLETSFTLDCIFFTIAIEIIVKHLLNTSLLQHIKIFHVKVFIRFLVTVIFVFLFFFVRIWISLETISLLIDGNSSTLYLLIKLHLLLYIDHSLLLCLLLGLKLDVYWQSMISFRILFNHCC
jgi:hypothetical protein